MGAEAETDESSYVGAAISGGARHKSARSVEVNSAGLGVVLRGIVWKDEGYRLRIRDVGSIVRRARASISTGSSWRGCSSNGSIACITGRLAAGAQRSS